MIAEEGRVQFDSDSNGILIKRARAVAVAFFLFHVVTTSLDWMHLDLPFLEAYFSKVPMAVLSVAIMAFADKRWMSQHISLYLCLLMLSLQLSLYIKSIQYGDYAPIASLVVFTCLFSAYFIPWSFRYHLAVTLGALLLVGHWMYGVASAADWITAARGTVVVAVVCITTAILAYFAESKRFEDWKTLKALLRNDVMFRHFAEHTSDIVFIWNPDLSIDYVSSSFERYTGRTVSELLTTSLKVSDLIEPKQRENYWKVSQEIIQGQERRTDLTVHHRDGTKFQLEAIGSPIIGSSGKVEKAIAVWRDITARTAKEKNLQQLANQDSLTRAYNQDYFQKLASAELEQASKRGQPGALLYADIDDYRALAERYSLAAADQVMIEVTARCREVLGEDTILGRIGGDSLLIFLPGKSAEAAAPLAATLISKIEASPILFEDDLLPVSICIGIASSDTNTEASYDGILDCSAKALYQAKRNGRGSCVIWSFAEA